ncbi:MAG: hypothetical protein FWH00_03600 [Oscillospiraceae bacterium]|nr:hypothetical protein [Oscillospiraceae bacterium]
MKELFNRAKKITRSAQGETLMESIVSLLILSILLISVTVIVQTALGMTSASLQRAEQAQDEINDIVRSMDYSSLPDIVITFPGGTS